MRHPMPMPTPRFHMYTCKILHILFSVGHCLLVPTETLTPVKVLHPRNQLKEAAMDIDDGLGCLWPRKLEDMVLIMMNEGLAGRALAVHEILKVFQVIGIVWNTTSVVPFRAGVHTRGVEHSKNGSQWPEGWQFFHPYWPFHMPRRSHCFRPLSALNTKRE